MCWKDVTENIYVWNCDSTLRGRLLGPWSLQQQLIRMQFQSRSFLWPAFPQNQEWNAHFNKNMRGWALFLVANSSKTLPPSSTSFVKCVMKAASISVFVFLSEPTSLCSNGLLWLLRTTHHNPTHWPWVPVDYKLLWAYCLPELCCEILVWKLLHRNISYQLQNSQEKHHSPKHLGQHCPAGMWLRCWGHERMGQTSWMHCVRPPWRKIGSVRKKNKAKCQVDVYRLVTSLEKS